MKKKNTKTIAPPNPAAKALAAKVVAVKPAVTKPAATAKQDPAGNITLCARINVGLGNCLTLRGEGPGLSWERGIPMECIAPDLWRVTVKRGPAIKFKVLINDITWCTGPDFSANGSDLTVIPEF